MRVLFDFEKENGNTFIVNVSIDVDKIIYDDTIEGTVDYSNLFSIIESEMSKEYNLIETVAHKISSSIHSQIKNIKLCRLEIIKKNPPIDGNVDNSSFIKAIWTVLLADFTMSLDNVLGVAGAAGHHYHLLIFGLVLSIICLLYTSPSPRD